MSRCFPFPPPGYAGKCSSHEALILSIKLQKERERAAISNREAEKPISDREREKSKSSERKKDKGDRKEKKDREERKKEKKEKKEKRKEEKAKTSAAVGGEKLDCADKLSKPGKALVESKGKFLGNSAELLERSSVTEEHGQPIDAQNASCSSDSTGNSSKRKRYSASPSAIQSNGNIIRIRLSTSQKRDEPSTSGSKELEVGISTQAREARVTPQSHVRPCVNLVRPESSIKQNVIINGQVLPRTASTSTATLQQASMVVSSLKEKAVESVSQKESLSSHDKVQPRDSLEKLSSHDKRMQKKESLYKKLFVDWAPPSVMVDDSNDDEEEDWLFGKKDEDRTAKRLRVSDDTQSGRDSLPCSATAVMQPRAHFLTDGGIHALPFTVPF